MKKLMPIVVAISMIVSGCATYVCRFEKDKDSVSYPPVYPATCYDIGGAYLACAWGGTNTGIPGIFCALVDMPFSLTTDTLFFPYDLIMWGKK